jgi:murein DD-endopeptidase MepM/ murein hydrolase activator NlpD
MKAYVLSISLFIALTIGSFTYPSQPSLAPVSEMEVQPSEKAFMKAQLAHLHHLHPIDIRQVPAIYPLTETEHVEVGSPFGMRNHPIHRMLKMHKGQDFAAPIGTPVIATADGIVNKTVHVIDNSGYGKHIILFHEEVFHGETYATLYAHLSRLYVKEGQTIARGDTIGLSGNTGTSTSPHLHYEVIRNGKRVNPLDYLM